MPVIFRWIFSGCISRSFVTLAALLSIYVIIESFDKARYLGHGLDGGLMIEYLLLKIPFMVNEFMPIIVLIGASIYLIELSRNHEMVAIRAAGLGINKLLMPLLTVALLAATLSFIIGEWVTPITNKRLDVIENVHIKQQQSASQGVQWLKDGQRFYRLMPLKEGRFAMVVIETDSEGGWRKRIDAASARFANQQWHLTDVHITTPSPEQGTLHEQVDSLVLNSNVGPETAELPKPRHMEFAELYHYIADLKHAGLTTGAYTYALHRKVSAPLASLLMVILATALCLNTGSRNSRVSWGIIGAISLGLLFYVIGNAGYLLAANEHISPAYAAWLPTLVFGGLGVYLLLKREGH